MAKPELHSAFNTPTIKLWVDLVFEVNTFPLPIIEFYLISPLLTTQ